MAYRLKRRQTVADGVRRVAHQQLARAAAELADTSLDPATRVHQVRKRLKKLRALLRLVRGDIGKAAFRREDRRLRDLGKRLSRSRDAQVMLDTAVTMAGDHPALAASFDALCDHLARRRDSVAPDDDRNADTADATFAELSGELAAVAARVDDWPLGSGGFALIEAGLERAYRRGRKRLRGLTDAVSDARMHDWRKRVKDHWYHSRLLENLWPGLMACYIDELKKLSELLGDYHDLAVFEATLAHLPDDVLGAGDRELWNDRVAGEKRALRRHAERLGRQVYAESPKRFRRRFRRYWRNWRGQR